MRLKQLLTLITFLWFLGPIYMVQAEVTKIDEYKKAIEKDPKDFRGSFRVGKSLPKIRSLR